MNLDPATSIFLNDFRMEEILKIVDEIKALNIDSLFINNRVEQPASSQLGILTYTPMFHRIEINSFDPLAGELYPNPDVEVLMMPKKTFIKNLNPNELYKQLMSK